MSAPEDEVAPKFTDRRVLSGKDAPEGQGENENVNPATEKTLEEQLAEAEEKAQGYLASWQRAAADFQNYKRRNEQERVELGRLANAALMINILPLIDDFDRAMQNVDASIAGLTWMDGIRLIHRKFQMLLDAAGVTEIEADGRDFDPNVHEAVTFGDGEDGKVVGVVQKGYKLGDRVLRPAMVVVGKSSPS
jgi:molecular chaperone GrpE